MTVQAFPSGQFATNAYVVFCPEQKTAAIIDPSDGSAEPMIAYIEKNKLQPAKILLTHSHWDHIVDVTKLKKRFNIPVLIHKLDAPNLVNPGCDGLPIWISIDSVNPDQLFEEGDVIPIGNLNFTVIHTPGHSPGGVCFYCPEKNILISGDTLFKGTIGNISFPTAQPNLMWKSLDKLAKLPAETKVFPGHGEATTIGAEAWLPQAKEYFGE